MFVGVLLLALFGLVGNCCILAAILRHCEHWQQNQGLIIITSVAVNDAGFCMMEVFLRVATPLCSNVRVSIYVGVLIITAMTIFDMVEMAHMMLMAVSRYEAIVHPTRYDVSLPPRTVGRLCVGAWAFCVVYAVVFFAVFSRRYYSLADGAMLVANVTVEHSGEWQQRALAAAYPAMVSVYPCSFVLCVLTLVCAYVPATLKIHLLKRDPASQAPFDVVICLQFLLVGGIWLAAYGFYVLSTLLGYNEAFSSTLLVFVFASNPIIWITFTKSIRAGVFALFARKSPATGNTGTQHTAQGFTECAARST